MDGYAWFALIFGYFAFGALFSLAYHDFIKDGLSNTPGERVVGTFLVWPLMALKGVFLFVAVCVVWFSSNFLKVVSYGMKDLFNLKEF